MFPPTFVLLLCATCYLLFFGLLLVAKKQHANRLFDEQGVVADTRLLVAVHMGGIVLFGVVAALLPQPLAFMPVPAATDASLPAMLTGLLVGLLSIFSWWLAEKKHRARACPTPTRAPLSGAFVAAYFLLRVVFICAYESWFRGYLLLACAAAFGVGAAVLLNVGLYAALHLVNGKAEVLGCLPFGAVLCGLCLWQGAAWPAVVLHLALTLPYEAGYLRKINSYLPPSHEDFSNGGLRLHRQ